MLDLVAMVFFFRTRTYKERSLVDVNVAAVAGFNAHHYPAKMVAKNEGRFYALHLWSFSSRSLTGLYFGLPKAFVVRLVQAIHFELQQQKSNVKIITFVLALSLILRCFWNAL